MRKIRLDFFIVLMLSAVVLAYFFPQGANSTLIPLETVIRIGIMLIFFFYGLKLSFQDIKKDLNNTRLHLLIQLTTFLLFPLIVLITKPFVVHDDKEIIWLAFMFLAVLPSTVSSSVVMVSIAKGNVPAAIFNATISGLIGILVTPLWMGLFVSKSTVHYDWGPIYLKLVTEILAPVLVGLVLQHFFTFFHSFTQKYRKLFTRFDQTVILLIVYNSFASSFVSNIFGSIQLLDFIIIFIGSLLLFYVVYSFTGWIAHKMQFNRQDTITIQFSGTKKSLLHGSVFAEVIFGSSVSMGIILLPIMVFHALQLFIISIIATNKARIDREASRLSDFKTPTDRVSG